MNDAEPGTHRKRGQGDVQHAEANHGAAGDVSSDGRAWRGHEELTQSTYFLTTTSSAWFAGPELPWVVGTYHYRT